MLTCAILTALALTSSAMEVAEVATATTVAADRWPARPNPPLYRSNPRGYTMGLRVSFETMRGDVVGGADFISNGGELSIDVAHADPYSLSNLDEIESQVLFNGHPNPPRFTIVNDPDGISRRIVTPVPSGQMSLLSIRTAWPAIAFASRVDEKSAAAATWPRSWPADVVPFLEPSTFIESNDPRFAAFVEQVSGGRLRRTAIYYAAKDLVRRAILEYRNVRAETVVRSVPDVDNGNSWVIDASSPAILGFRVMGAANSIGQLQISPPDLVCTCVAVLRAAGIPARPVIGIDSGRSTRSGGRRPRDRTHFAVWGEFRLPGCGWVPFDPYQMRGQGLQHLTVQQPWRWFGTIRDLNRRVALAYDFAPFCCGTVPSWPCGWALAMSWRSTGASPAGFVEPVLISRGTVRP